MPPYLRLGSIPRSSFDPCPHVPGFAGEGIYYEEVVGLAEFSRGYSIVYPLRPADAHGPSGAGGDSPRPISAINRPARIIT